VGAFIVCVQLLSVIASGERPAFGQPSNPATLQSDERDSSGAARVTGAAPPGPSRTAAFRWRPTFLPPGPRRSRPDAPGLAEHRLRARPPERDATATRSGSDKGALPSAGRGEGTRRRWPVHAAERRPRPAGGAVRGPKLTFEDRAELLQGHVPGRPKLRAGPRRRRRRRRGAHGSVPITGRGLSLRGVGLRSGGQPCPASAARPRAALVPRRACRLLQGPGPLSPQPRRGSAQVAGAGSPGSFKQGARAPRAGRRRCACAAPAVCPGAPPAFASLRQLAAAPRPGERRALGGGRCGGRREPPIPHAPRASERRSPLSSH
jgi:hypothetical protein